ncbi:MAG: phosphate acyltransferase PlsX [Chloroflexota bacterium]|nr:phosphate acyltransferase PlsX [Chloroflexota bacterium]
MTHHTSKGKKLRISIDAMGGDLAPSEIVKGAIEGARELDTEIVLVGIVENIEREIAKHNVEGVSYRIVEAAEVIKDGQEAAFEVFRRPNNSVSIAAKLVKEGEADAAVSAGNTGACMVSAMQHLGMLPGIDRPMVGGAFVGLAPNTVVLDLGAVVGAQPYHMVNFAVAGVVYVRSFMGIENPTVALLNVGAEEGKGNELAKEAYPLLKGCGLNFIGNVEGMDIPLGRANVIVCDGFVGNILVKFCEGLGRTVTKWLGAELKDQLPESALKITNDKLYRLLSPAVALGGGPMWGVDGVACVAHGSSDAAQIAGTMRQARQALESGFVDKLRVELGKIQGLVNQQ